MDIKKKLGYAGGGAAVLIGLILLFVQPWNHADSVLSAEAVEETVISQYPGTVEKSSLENGEYHLRISTDTGTYEFTVDSSNGSILSIQQISKSGEKERAILSRDTVKEKLLSETGGKLLFLELITKEDQDIYKAKVKTDTERTLFEIDPYTGEVLSRQTVTIDQEDDEEVDEEEKQKFLAEEEVEKIAMAEVAGEVDDTELRGEDTSHPYYLVEIETDDDKEAVIQIHAITGKVQSVTWDD
ncbi:PepSY domain-containing protein [Paenibacillus gallinarum]|uniref:PepSY domain-containing protein n=1 Tax=Paenibacillus gallinarum TaxID=2762232 RepID=A0ABR8T2L1_9BACL|nr:PepSY domain-containing protein [Paenibacillus gallinarum]MBD7970000.1 PepSY domain-containing protein [Paenibacillus gallinarum]